MAERDEIRILQAMESAGLTTRERDVYWLHIGCEASFADIGELLVLAVRIGAAKIKALRAFWSAEDKLILWVRSEGIERSPLYLKPLNALRESEPRDIA